MKVLYLRLVIIHSLIHGLRPFRECHKLTLLTNMKKAGKKVQKGRVCVHADAE